MKSFKVSWYATGYRGTSNYLVVANTIEEAKELWEKFIQNDRHISYSYKQALKGQKNHYSGYVVWKEMGETDKEEGCYKLAYNAWNAGSDHLRD